MICCYYIDILLLQGGWTALHRACWKGHLEVVKHLLNNNADISATDNVSNYVTKCENTVTMSFSANSYIMKYQILCTCVKLPGEN